MRFLTRLDRRIPVIIMSTVMQHTGDNDIIRNLQKDNETKQFKWQAGYDTNRK